MKKIGIVTWHKNGNYGGTLQAFAMSHVLNRYGLDPVFINYKKNNVNLIRILRNIAFGLLYPKSAKSRKKIFEFVKENLNETCLINNDIELKNYGKICDAVICGSDQIWNSLNGVNPFYFLQFVESNKRIAYAPSIGLSSISDEFLQDFIKCVSEIPHLSVREIQGSEYINKMVGIKAEVVLDPTLLITRTEWLQFTPEDTIERMGLEKKKYILCYFLGEDNKYRPFVDRMQQYLGLPIYYVSSKRKNYKNSQLICDPFELISVIDNAAYVLTDSFHGLVLSINMETPVAVFERFSSDEKNSENSRIYSVVELLHSKALVSDIDMPIEEFIHNNKSSSQFIDVHLLELRNNSTNYLKNSLETVLNCTL